MRNLIYLLKQYYNFFIFIVLEIICISIVFSNNSFQQSSYLNSARKISSSFYTKKENLISFMTLKEVNDSLLKENALLKSKLGIQIERNPLKDTSYQSQRTIDSVTKETRAIKYIPARVINNSIDKKINHITLNVGKNQGIKRNMAVVSEKGVVGKITHVNDNYSVAVSILSDKLPISCVVPDGSIGSARWDGKDPNLVLLTGVPLSANLKIKDTILTNSYSFFPENIMIGRVAKYVNGNYLVWLSTNFSKLKYVYVIEDIANIERKILEDSVQAEIIK